MYKIFIALICISVALVSSLCMELNAQELIPDNLVIRDSYVPGTGLPIGQIVIVDGTIIIVHENEWRGFLAKPKMMLYAGDILISRSNSRTSIRLKDNSRISMGSDTKLTLSRLLFDQSYKHRNSFIKMSIGKARFRVNKLSDFKQSSFKVKTPTALIGVRGSDFIIQTTLERTEVTTLSDTLLTVISLEAPGAPPALLNDYAWAMVEHGQLPSEVEAIGLEAIEALKNAFPMESMDFLIQQPDDHITVKDDQQHHQMFSKQSARHKLETKMPSFDSNNGIHQTKQYADHPSFNSRMNQSDTSKSILDDDSDPKKTILLSTESSFSIKKHHLFHEFFSDNDESVDFIDRHIRVSQDKLIDPEDISSIDLIEIDDQLLEEDLSDTINEDSDDQEQIYEEGQIENINLPWFPKKPIVSN